MATETSLVPVARQLAEEAGELRFSEPVTHVYNPLDYAWPAHRTYLERYGGAPKKVLLVGMNPGPWGMVQTGVPFGEVTAVRDWLGIEVPTRRPETEHPKRPVEGLDCHRSEVSGARLWGWARDRFESPQRFFERFFISNYCPLAFLESGGRNRTPDKLPSEERAPLYEICDRALRRTVEALGPVFVIGIGAFAESRASEALDGYDGTIGRILHPSPANPQANRDWAGTAERQLRDLGIVLP